MDKTVAFMELKYGHIYGSTPWKKIVCDVSILIYSTETDRIRIYSKQFRGDVQIVLSSNRSDELGITTGRDFVVLDMSNGKTYPFNERYVLHKGLEKRKLKEAKKVQAQLKQFMVGIMKYQNIDYLVTFGGSRDITLCEQAGVRFNRLAKVDDTQRLLQKYTKHLFSLNMISEIINFEYDESGWIKSNNCQYRIGERTQFQMKPDTATYDVARQFLSHQEFTKHQQSMIIKAALQMQKVQEVLKAKEAAKAAEAASNKSTEDK
jgi:hypothetical protein